MTEIQPQFKLGAVKLVRERGVSVSPAARDLDCTKTCCVNGARADG